MQKKITFGISADSTEFDRTVDQLQRKIREIYKGSDNSRQQFENQVRMGAGGIGKAPTVQDRHRQDLNDEKARRDTAKFIKEQIRDQEKLQQVLNKQVETMRILRKEQGASSQAYQAEMVRAAQTRAQQDAKDEG